MGRLLFIVLFLSFTVFSHVEGSGEEGLDDLFSHFQRKRLARLLLLLAASGTDGRAKGDSSRDQPGGPADGWQIRRRISLCHDEIQKASIARLEPLISRA